MEQAKIDRINFLARKSKVEKLSEKELEEQKELRAEYIAEVKKDLQRQLDNTYIVDENGNKEKLKKKSDNETEYLQ